MRHGSINITSTLEEMPMCKPVWRVLKIAALSPDHSSKG
jgi:hypothetical protein